MNSIVEEILKGGQTTEFVVKIDNTVHRSVGPHSEYTHKLLLLLEKKKYPYSPRFLGIDTQGREILTFVEGDVARNITWTDKQLKKVVTMVREFHDATAGSELCADKEVVCHRDLAPWNTILHKNEPVGFIDFDGAEPGKRVEDLAYFLWTFLELGTNYFYRNTNRKDKVLMHYLWIF